MPLPACLCPILLCCPDRPVCPPRPLARSRVSGHTNLAAQFPQRRCLSTLLASLHCIVLDPASVAPALLPSLCFLVLRLRRLAPFSFVDVFPSCEPSAIHRPRDVISRLLHMMASTADSMSTGFGGDTCPPFQYLFPLRLVHTPTSLSPFPNLPCLPPHPCPSPRSQRC